MMGDIVEHNSHIVKDNRWFRSSGASEAFEKAGGIIIQRDEKYIAIVRIADKQVRALCTKHGLEYLHPIFSYIEPSPDIKDITPKEQQPSPL